MTGPDNTHPRTAVAGGIAFPRIRFSVIVAAHCLGAMNLLAILASSPLIRDDLGLSAVEIGLLASAYSAALAVFSLPAGRVSDRIGVRAALILAVAILSSGALAVAWSQSFGAALLGLGLCGAGYSLVNPAAGRAVQMWYPAQWQGTLLGLKQTGVPLGGAIGTGAAAFGPMLGWNTVITIMGVVTLMAGLAFLTLPANNRAPDRAPAQSGLRGEFGSIVALLSNARLGRINTASGLTNGGQFILWTYLTEFLRQGAQMGVPVANACLTLLQLSSIAGRIFWGWIGDRWLNGNHRRALITLTLISAAALAAMILVSPFNALLLAPMLAILLGFTVCAATGVQVALSMQSAPAWQSGGAIGYNMLVTNIGGVLAPPAFGLIVDHAPGYGVAWAVAAFGLLTAAALLAKDL